MTDEQYSELLSLARRNGVMLSEILAYMRKADDPKYKANENDRDFVMNVVANALVERMFDNQQQTNNIRR